MLYLYSRISNLRSLSCWPITMLLSKLIENILTWSYENFKVNRSCTCTDKRQKCQKRYNISGRKCVWAQTCVGTIVCGHNRVWAQTCLGTNLSGHNRVWAQSCVGTNVCGHNRVWAQSCLGTIVSGHNRVWAQSCLGTIVSGHNRVWAQSCQGTIVSGHNRVWAQSCGLNRVGSIMYGPNRGGTINGSGINDTTEKNYQLFYCQMTWF